MQEIRRRIGAPLSAFLVFFLAACGGDGPTDPRNDEPGVRVMLGAGVTDTIDAQPLQALVVEVRGLDGNLASGAIVRFEAQPPADTSRRYESAIYVCALTAPTCGLGGGFGYTAFTVDTTDDKGQAKAIVRLGRVAGRAVVRISAPEFGVGDSATYTVTPGSPARVLALATDTAMDIGATAKLSGRVVDRYGNLRSEVPTLSAGAGNAVTVDGATGIVTGRDMGTQWVFARYAALADSTSVRVVPIGRLVVWDAWQQVVRLVNLNGSESSNTIISQVHSDFGVFPRFDATRGHVTLHTGDASYGGPSRTVVVVDTTGAPRRVIGPASGFTTIVAVRQIADGSVLVVGRRDVDASTTVNGLWLVDAGNAVTLLAALPGMALAYGGADISHDGTRVAYLAAGPSFGSELRVFAVSNGAITVLEPNARSPRWSSQGDRVAYLVPSGGYSEFDGVAVVTNADGSGRRDLGSAVFSPGLAWSPDGKYIVGRSSSSFPSLRLLRVSDGATVLLSFRSPNGNFEDYYQPDWR